MGSIFSTLRTALIGILIALGNLHAATNTIVIAAEDDWPPYSYKGPSPGEPLGFTPELVREAFRIKGVNVIFETVPYSRCMQLVKTGKVTACFNTNKNEENTPEYHWHATPIFDEGVSYFALSEVDGKDLKIKDLEGSTVGVTSGYAYAPAFMRNEKIRKFEANSDDHLLKMLLARRVRFALINTLPGLLRIRNDPAYTGKIKIVGQLNVHGFFLNFSKATPEGKQMADLFEAGLQELKKSGKYDRMYTEFRKRIGVPH